MNDAERVGWVPGDVLERLAKVRGERDQARRLLREIRRYVLHEDDVYAREIDALLGPTRKGAGKP